jgi:hypothetical protein
MAAFLKACAALRKERRTPKTETHPVTGVVGNLFVACQLVLYIEPAEQRAGFLVKVGRTRWRH